MKTARVFVNFLFLLLAFQAGRATAQTSPPPENPRKPLPTFHLPEVKSPDFRQARWGMTKEEVKRSETVEIQPMPPSATTLETVGGTSCVAGMPCTILYEFAENQLASAGYVITSRHTNANNYLDDYETVKGVLREKYGTPLRDETTWDNPLYRDDPSHYGFAVSIGHLSKGAFWETPTTRVGVFIKGDNYDITIVVMYRSLALQNLVEAEKAKKAKAANPF